MVKQSDEPPRKRFSKSGHTTHNTTRAYEPAYQPPAAPPVAPPPPPSAPPPPRYTRPAYEPPHYERPRRDGDERDEYDLPRRSPDNYQRPAQHDPYETDSYRTGHAETDAYPREHAETDAYRRPDAETDAYPRAYAGRDPDPRPARSGYGSPTYHAPPGRPAPSGAAVNTGTPTVGRAAVNLGKATVVTTGKAARTVTRKVITASEADGAKESGLTALIWNQVLSYGTDAMITVALAGTVFFGASSSAQRGNVLLYLLVTVAPFAVVAPVIGPALDRLQHGRRWTMAGTAIGRAVLALIMAGHPTELLVLYPCALGSLVLSKAYGVVRAAAAPRLVPPGMTLTAANSKLTIFGLGSTIVLGGFVGALIKTTGSYSVGLIATAIAFAACAFFAFKLPKQVDSAQAAPRHPEEPIRPKRQDKVPPLSRIHEWARRGFDPHIVIALQGESVLRLLSGMLTIYLAFFVESTKHGLTGVIELGGVVGAAGAGNFIGTAIGTRLRMTRPETVIVVSTCLAGAVCVITAFTFSILVAIIAMLLASVANALSKIALDSLIQNDVIETLRSSAFARSETFLQLAWVVGAAIGVGIPSTSSDDGTIAFAVAAVIVCATAAVIVLRMRAMDRHNAGLQTHPRAQPDPAGSVMPRSLD